MKANRQLIHKLFIPLLVFYSQISQAAFFNANDFAQNLSASLGCSQFRDLFWNELYRQVQSLDSTESLKNKKFDQIITGDTQVDLLSAELTQLLLKEAPMLLKIKNKHQLLEVLTALELGDQSTSVKKTLYQKADYFLSKIEQHARNYNIQCEHEDEEKIIRKSRVQKSFLPNAGSGVRKTLATFYQSCSTLDLVPLKYADESVQGISITGTHSDGVGKKRVVSSVSKVNATHHYLKNLSSPAEQCIDVRLNPPIYDYGGKPYASSALDSPLDFFRNAGSGTSAMGTDCSGLVFANLASVGLKLKSSTALKAISVNGISSTMLSNPSANGLDCLERVSFSATESLREGDIISKPGHTVSVYSVGVDPFGISGITKISDCVSSKISSSRYDFTLVQSSPIKNGIGVNRISGSDYVKLQSSWAAGFTFYALKACRAKFGTISNSASSDKFAIVRHKGTSNCIAEPIVLTGETCTNSCSF